jgi:hypothetical protein
MTAGALARNVAKETCVRKLFNLPDRAGEAPGGSKKRLNMNTQAFAY